MTELKVGDVVQIEGRKYSVKVDPGHLDEPAVLVPDAPPSLAQRARTMPNHPNNLYDFVVELAERVDEHERLLKPRQKGPSWNMRHPTNRRLMFDEDGDLYPDGVPGTGPEDKPKVVFKEDDGRDYLAPAPDWAMQKIANMRAELRQSRTGHTKTIEARDALQKRLDALLAASKEACRTSGTFEFIPAIDALRKAIEAEENIREGNHWRSVDD